MAYPSREQMDVCRRVGARPDAPLPDQVVGLGPVGALPVNGLRHPPDGRSSGWYLWTGVDLDRSDDAFFRPIHVSHLSDHDLAVSPYLALPAGWRFQIGPGHEDIWFDSELLLASE
jgi:hypothetical protein